MTPKELQSKLDELLQLPGETEWVEFKEARDTYDVDKLGKYFSALSNEANLKAKNFSWFILGVNDASPRAIVGTSFRRTRPELDGLKADVACQTSERLTFHEIYELNLPEGRVLLFQIPPASRGIPTSWKGHCYGREGESLAALSTAEFETIRSQSPAVDWSAEIVPEASLVDLSEEALTFAREQYRQKNPRHTAEMGEWDDVTFLNKARLLRTGQITRAALLLVGKPESSAFLSPAHARITWILKDRDGADEDYQHFGLPFLLAGDLLFQKIRNRTIRHLPSGTLFPHEISQYDPRVLREVLHNCIAHQDYTRGGYAHVVEFPNALRFSNPGAFIPGSVEAMIESDAPPDIYRNRFLADAMVNLNMIDTIGSGIRRMFKVQRDRSFPMPDYDLSDSQKVIVQLSGEILDENYTRLLLKQTDLELLDVIALDKVQKKRPIDDPTLQRLRSWNLVEGRRPNLFVSNKVAEATGDKATYIKNRAFDRQYYKDAVCLYLQQFESASLKELEDLLISKLSDTLDNKQKHRYIKNLLQTMKQEGSIHPEGTRRWTRWRLNVSMTKASKS